MNQVAELFDRSPLIKGLLNALPCGIAVVDESGRVRQVNDILERTLGLTGESVIGRKSGDILGCIHALRNSAECGDLPPCQTCELRRVALAAIDENKEQRSRAPVQLSVGGVVRDVTLLLTASPIKYRGNRYALMIIEDITKIGALRLRQVNTGRNGMVGQSPGMLELYDFMTKVAQTDVPVLVKGETGTGKELVALAIHGASGRAGKNFVAINCAALPHGLLESELFGHVKGAFTGAFQDKKGRFELADGGTMFLDEIGEMDLSLQAKLLRVLQDGTFERVGCIEKRHVDVRLISATNRNLEQEVAAGNFRSDLYYRLSVVPIAVPPLRERRSDIPLLVNHFIESIADKSGFPEVSISSTALSLLQQYDWPGNVRELRNTIHYALIKNNGKMILPEDLPAYCRQTVERTPKAENRKGKLDIRSVEAALKKTKGNRLKAARILGVSRSTLYRFIDEKKPKV